MSMGLLDLMLERRSVRKYSGEPIPEEKLEKIIQAGLLAPTSRNLKPWEFYVVRGKSMLDRLARSKAAGAAFLEGADAAIVVASDSTKADTWIEDDSIAMSFMHLMAAEQGVGSCWIQIHLRKTESNRDAEAKVRRILDLEENQRIVGILALGMPAEESKPHTLEEIDKSKVHWVIGGEYITTAAFDADENE